MANLPWGGGRAGMSSAGFCTMVLCLACLYHTPIKCLFLPYFYFCIRLESWDANFIHHNPMISFLHHVFTTLLSALYFTLGLFLYQYLSILLHLYCFFKKATICQFSSSAIIICTACLSLCFNKSTPLLPFPLLSTSEAASFPFLVLIDWIPSTFFCKYLLLLFFTFLCC